MKVTKPQVVSLVTEWRRILGVPGEWRVDVYVNDHHFEADAGYGDAVGYIIADERSWEADLKINAYNIGKRYALEDTVVHELLHLLNYRYERAVMCLFSGESKKMGKDLVESHTELLSRAFMRARRR